MSEANTNASIYSLYRSHRTPWIRTDQDRGATALPQPRVYLTTGIVAVVDLIALLAGLMLSTWNGPLATYETHIHGVPGAWSAVGIFLVTSLAMGLYPPVGMTALREFRLLVMAVTLTYGALAVMSWVATRDEFLGPEVLAWAWVAGLVFLPLGRTTVRGLFARSRWWGTLAVVTGSGSSWRTVLRTLQQQPWLGLKAAAVVDPSQKGQGRGSVRRVPIVENWNAASAIGVGMSVHYTHTHFPSVMRQRLIQPIDPVMIRQVLKRSLDLVLVCVGGVLALPLIGLIAVMIKLDSPGPVFYGHTRIGRGGKRFRAWKFRSMVMNADQVLDEYLFTHPEFMKEWRRTQKLKNDPRITRAGRLLRKTSMDELPQIWNVLVDEMSLVGPRPIVDEEITHYGSMFDQLISVNPGITGLWQVSGRTDTTYKQRVKLDMDYVQGWSPRLELRILARTVWVVLTGKGAY